MVDQPEKDFSQYNIVIVDDSEFYRNELTSTLARNSFKVTGEYQNYTELTEALREKTIHCILLDVVLPKKNGIDLAKDIKRLFPKIQIIMMSSLDHDKIIIDAIGAGAVDFIKKPPLEEKLIRSMKNALNKLPEVE